MRLESHDAWFRYKFLVIGALFYGAFLLNKSNHGKNIKVMESFLGNDFACVLLSIGCMISLLMDLYIRHSLIINEQLGLWVKYYFEPLILNSLQDVEQSLGWEQFIRKKEGLHSDIFYGVFFWTFIHLFTIVLYSIYLFSFRYYTFRFNENSGKSRLVVRCFIAVHIVISYFSFGSHFIPGNFCYLLPFTSSCCAATECTVNALTRIFHG